MLRTTPDTTTNEVYHAVSAKVRTRVQQTPRFTLVVMGAAASPTAPTLPWDALVQAGNYTHVMCVLRLQGGDHTPPTSPYKQQHTQARTWFTSMPTIKSKDSTSKTFVAKGKKTGAWKLATDQPGWEPGHKNVVVKIVERGRADGLGMGNQHQNRLGSVDHVTKPLALMGISQGFRLTHLDNRPLSEIKEIKDNRSLKALIETNDGPTELTFKPPKSASSWNDFKGKEFFRLFTDGGRRSPMAQRGHAGCGWVILRGGTAENPRPFSNYRPNSITDADGTVVAQGYAYLGFDKVSNNEAEYWALLAGLRKCLSLGIVNIQHMCDSDLVVGYESGSARRNFKLCKFWEICQRFRSAITNLGGKLVSRHFFRERNTIADGLVNMAMNKRSPPRPMGHMSIIEPDVFPNVKHVASFGAGR